MTHVRSLLPMRDCSNLMQRCEQPHPVWWQCGNVNVMTMCGNLMQRCEQTLPAWWQCGSVAMYTVWQFNAKLQLTSINQPNISCLIHYRSNKCSSSNHCDNKVIVAIWQQSNCGNMAARQLWQYGNEAWPIQCSNYTHFHRCHLHQRSKQIPYPWSNNITTKNPNF